MPVEFGNLPESASVNASANGAPRTRMTDEAEQLKARPMAWAKIATRNSKGTASALASNIRRGKAAAFKDGKYETAIDECDVWARYVGANS